MLMPMHLLFVYSFNPNLRGSSSCYVVSSCLFFLLPQTELGIYNRKQESKKERKKTRSRPRKRPRACFLSFSLDRYRCFFFLGRKRVFFFFFALLFSFIKSHLRILRICNLSTVVEPLYNEGRDEIPRTMRKVSYQSISFS